jgi:glycosyltransferase involved in cell wall biosynthesis
MTEDLGLSDHVHFTGFCAEPATFVRHCDVYVQPSERESFGIAVLEAMLLGKPVVAARTGGIPEVVEHGASGWLVDPGNAEALAEGLAHVLSPGAGSGSLGAAAAERAVGRFDIQRMVQAYEQVYMEVTGAAC